MRHIINILISLVICTTTFAANIEKPLPAKEAFDLSASVLNQSSIQLVWSIKPGYFLYHNRIRVESNSSESLDVYPLQFPDPQFKTHQGKTLLIYRDHLTLNVPFKAHIPGEQKLKVYYQGCSDQGFCYPPMTKTLTLAINGELKLDQLIQESNQISKKIETKVVSSQPDQTKQQVLQSSENTTESMLVRIEQLFSSGNALLVILTFFGFGLLLSFTPCILPMIPVLSGMIVGHGANITPRKAFLLSLSYVLSMSVTYSVIGGVIAILGSNLQMQMQSPVVIGCFSLVFVLLALSMFGVYDLRLPLSWQNKLARVTRHQSHGHYLNAALMGSLSILILSPCITPPLLGALSYIAQSGNLILGLAALFFLGLGMGTPLILVGASAGKLLPKAGKWMNTVKNLFGILLLGVAIHLLSRLLPHLYTMILWSFLLVFTGVGCKPFSNAQTIYEKCRQGLGILCLAYGLLILYGASAGHTNPLLPLQPSLVLNSQHASKKIHVTTLARAEQVLQDAKSHHQPVFLDFTADWCESCKILAQSTLIHPRVIHALNDMIWLEIDLTPNNQDSIDLLHHFQVIAPPTFQFYNQAGEDIKKLQLVGEIPADVLVKHLNMLLND